MKKDRLNIFIIAWTVVTLLLMGLLLFFTLRTNAIDRKLERLQESISRISQVKPQNGVDGRTPTHEELTAIIRPLLPLAIPGKDGTDGKDGKNGKDGRDGKSCTTYMDENNDVYISCPDGTQSLIPKPEQPRQIELCSTQFVPFGWRYVDTLTCLKVKGS